ncbi:MAG: elongation factor G [Pirellulaceae bacterium]|nr:elongation factor G [Pirellulaceae bacterium]
MANSVHVRQRRNIAFCGHGSSGKTTLIDSLLINTGAVSGHHSVDDGTSICDFDPEEKAHKHTVEAKVTHCEFEATHFSLLDTPGYADFIGQTIGALAGVDSAAICIHAHAGVEVNTRRVFHAARQAGLPTALVISRLDGDNIDFAALVKQIIAAFGDSCALLNIPKGISESFSGVIDMLDPSTDTSGAVIACDKVREHLIETIIEGDDAMMEKYFEGIVPSVEDLKAAIPKAVLCGQLIPIFCTSSKLNIGLSEMLRGLKLCAPSPDAISRHGVTEDGQEMDVLADPDAPLVARVFETHIDPFVQKLSFIRIYSGTLSKDQSVHVCSSKTTIRIPQLLEIQGNQTAPIDRATAGQIVAVAKVDELHTGTMLGDTQLPPIPFPRPMVGLALSPRSRGDENKLAAALHKLIEEDATLRLDRDVQTSELVIVGMSEFHLKLILERMHYRDKLDVDTKDPKIPLRETIQTEAEGFYRHKKQSGGRGQFGEVHIRMFPLPLGTDIKEFAVKERFPNMKHIHYDESCNFLWVDSVVGASIPGNFMPAIEKGFKERMVKGIIAGYQVQDVAVEVHYGKHHQVDSSEAAFKIAGAMVFRNVFREANPCLLEPYVRMDVTAPEANVGDIFSDMSGRNGRVSGSETIGGGYQVVHCEVPFREVLHYNRTLSSLTAGQGSYTIELDHYEPMPHAVQQQYMIAIKEQEEELV